MKVTLNYNGRRITVEYDVRRADPSGEPPTFEDYAEITAVFLGNHNITKILSDVDIETIQEKIQYYEL